MSKITLDEVIDTNSGVVIKSSEFFANDESVIFKQRSKLETAIQSNNKLWICPICGDFIKIKGKWDGFVSMHFSHVANNYPCPLKEKNRFSKEELLCYRYNGQKEGERHKFLKCLIGKKLSSDNRFSNVKVDKRFNGASNDWRKPDVQATFDGKEIAFEVQLSTTFLNVIAERKEFYRKNGIYLIWVFDRYHSSVENMRFTEKDIFFPNHHNAFFIDKDDTSLKFNLICGYEVPMIKEGKIVREFMTKKIAFDDLTLTNDYETYFFNYDEAKKNAEIGLFLKLIEKTTNQGDVKDVALIYENLFNDYDVNPNDRVLLRLISSILSIKTQKPIGYRLKFISILHHLLEEDKKSKEHFVQYIFNAIKAYDAKKFILSEDRKERFMDKAGNYYKQKYQLCTKYDPFLKALFPELSGF